MPIFRAVIFGTPWICTAAILVVQDPGNQPRINLSPSFTKRVIRDRRS